jgi:hypothetical protein
MPVENDQTMGNFDVMTALLAKLLGLDPVSIPIPIAVMGMVLDIALATLVVVAVWFTLKLATGFAADVLEVQNLRQRLVVARGLTRHDFEQVRKAIRGWYVLMIRYGTDDYLRNMAGEADRNVGRPRYSTLPMKLSLSATGEAVLGWTLPVHRRLGTQFRCYIATRAGADGPAMLTDMLAHYDEIEVLPPDVPEPSRLYFLVKRFPTTTTAEGTRQNFVLPE